MPTEDPAAEAAAKVYRFGPFFLRPGQKALTEGDSIVRLGSRALEILLMLVERAGQLVGKEELIARVWPQTFVDEVNLRVHVAGLRRALGEHPSGYAYLVTVPGRGYQFSAPVLIEKDSSQPEPTTYDRPAPQTLPLPQSRVIGREDILVLVKGHLLQRRFVTIVGPGGIGKTTVAVAVAGELAGSYPDGVHFVDLASVSIGAHVAGAVAAVLGLPIFSADPLPGVISAAKNRRLMVVLDNCEQVAWNAAIVAESLLEVSPGVNVLATSREPLRAVGERVVRLPPLGTPPASPTLTAVEALSYPAVQLFVERAAGVLDGFDLTDANAPIVAQLCARLDGVALAIELAAGHAAAFDLQNLVSLIDRRFQLLARGRRTALPRQQTMSAVLDWSYDMLPETERLLLRRLSVFDGATSLSAVQAVTSDGTTSPEQVITDFASLIDRSLVFADIDESGAYYRLLNTTRAYALGKLTASGEYNAIARRHAEYYLRAIQSIETTWVSRSSSDWLVIYGKALANFRAALDWAFSPVGDPALGVALSAAGAPILFDLSLAEECRRRAARALAEIERVPPDRKQEMMLRAALVAAQMYTPGPVPETYSAWQEVLRLAEELQDERMQARALWGLWTSHIYGGDPGRAIAFARRFESMAEARSDTTLMLYAERIIAICLHYKGEQDAAATMFSGMLARYEAASHRFPKFGLQINHGLMAQATLARVLWLQGFPDQAAAMASSTAQAVRLQGHAISTCYVLYEATILLAILGGEWQSAERALDEIRELASRSGLAIWESSEAFVRIVVRLCSGVPVQLEAFSTALSAVRATGYGVHVAWLSGVAGAAFATQGDAASGLQLITDALETCTATSELWCLAELQRLKGEVLSVMGAPASQSLLQQSLETAQQQDVLSLEMRAALSLVRTATGQARIEARTQLRSVLGRFSEGFNTADFTEARWLLNADPPS